MTLNVFLPEILKFECRAWLANEELYLGGMHLAWG